jgi:uncharacterized protein YecT (DUF1311 family)
MSYKRTVETVLFVYCASSLYSPASAAQPSFDCATAKASFEKAVCGDVGLAALDVAIDRAYRAALTRLQPNDAAALRSDQRAFASGNADDYDIVEQEIWKKATEPHKKQPERAKLALRKRLSERLAFLEGLDTSRRGLTGLWVAHNARLLVSAATAATSSAEQAVVLEGSKFEFVYYSVARLKTCDFGSFRAAVDPVSGSHTGNGPNRVIDGKIVLDASHFAQREGIRLEIGPPEQPDEALMPAGDYCKDSYIHSPAAVMFPVKPAAALLPVRPDRYRDDLGYYDPP